MKKSVHLMVQDCDLYTGSKDIFDSLGSNIKVGTILVFDELVSSCVSCMNSKMQAETSVLNRPSSACHNLLHADNHDKPFAAM